MTSFLPRVETTTSGISAGCVSGSETLFAVQSQIQKLNMLRGLSWPSGVTSALRQSVLFLFQTHVRAGTWGRLRLQKFIAETWAFCTSACGATNVYFFFFFLSRGKWNLQVWQPTLIIWVASWKKKKKNTPGFLNGAFERDTREKGVGSPPSQTQRIWPVFKNEAARAECVSCTKKKNTKESTRLKWVKKGGWQGGTVMWDDKEVACQRGSWRRETEISINNV